MNDIQNAINQLQNMLSTDDGRAELSDMVQNFTENSSSAPEDTNLPLQSDFGGNAMESLFKIRSILDSINATDDPRIRLLSALKPYLSNSRSVHIDNAIKIMSLGKIPSVLKNMRG